MQNPHTSSIFHASFVTNKPIDNVWHDSTNHCDFGTLKLILQNCNVRCSTDKNFCSTCMLGKNQQLPFSSFVTIYSHSLELVFADV